MASQSVYSDKEIYDAIEVSARSIGIENVRETRRQALVELLKAVMYSCAFLLARARVYALVW